MTRHRAKREAPLVLSVLLLSFTLFPTLLFAVGSGGFENASFSASSLSQGNAVVAQADEPAAISYNPAGIVDLPGIQVQSNAAFISLFTRLKDTNNATTRSSGTISMIPTGYVTINPGKLLNDRLAIGIGSDSPFGMGNKYDSNHPAVHYTGYKTWLKMFTIKPVIALKLFDWLNIGGGPMYYRIFDFGSILAYPNRLPQLTGAIPGPPILALFPDGQVRANLSGNSWGWHLGVLLKPHKKHRLGFYFRSPVHVKLKGQVKVENAFNPFNAAFQKQFGTGAHAKMNLPMNMTVAYAFRPTDRTTVEVDFGFTRWSTFRRLYIDSDPVNAIDDAILQAIGMSDTDYRDAFTLQIGGNHKVNDKLTVRGGWMWFWTPVPKHHFKPSVPDSNSMSVSVGASYKFWKNFTADLAYFHRFWWRRRIDNDISEALGTTVDGKYFSYAQELMASITYHFDPFSKSEPKGDISVDGSPGR